MKTADYKREIVYFITHYYSTRSDKFDDQSRLVLRFKNGDPLAFSHFSDLAEAWLRKYFNSRPITLCTIPSSKMGFTNSITRLASSIAEKLNNATDGTAFVSSVRSRDSFCKSGKRSADDLLSSVCISDSVKNKFIVLMDDVSTTGTSMKTIKNAILQKGAAAVCCFSIAKTFIYWISVRYLLTLLNISFCNINIFAFFLFFSKYAKKK